MHSFSSPKIDGEVLSDAYHRAFYSTDASIYQIQPRGVVLPKTADDVVQLTKLAAEAGVPLIPRGSGTSLSGQVLGDAFVVDFSKYMKPRAGD